MAKKFDVKAYLNKERVYQKIPGYSNISRVFYWNKSKQEYTIPANGKPFLARRHEVHLGARKRIAEYFNTLEEAHNWQVFITEFNSNSGNAKILCPDSTTITQQFSKTEAKEDLGETFGEVISEWQMRMYPTYRKSTQVDYDKLIRLNFASLVATPIRAFTPKLIDEWIDSLRSSTGRSVQARKRQFFRHELKLLGTVLKYYQEYHDDSGFIYPIKKRHRQAVNLRRDYKPVPKDLSLDEFTRFRSALLGEKHGEVMAAMATVQYYQALRVSEVAALHVEDINFDKTNPSASRVRVVRHVMWIRRQGVKSFIEGGFKNSKISDGIKEQPLFPESYQTLKNMVNRVKNGLIFIDEKRNTFFEYRQIQNAYDKAFAKAGLQYTGTHILRHGGTRRVYNATGDVAIAQQILGNKSLESTLVYAQRNTNALNEVAKGDWDAMPTNFDPPPKRAALRLVVNGG